MRVTKDELRAAMRARKVANLRYEQLIIKARHEGWSNTEIARAVGVSEAAIRLYFLRHSQVVTSDKVSA
jgi:DNA-directed RNA polymerase specialized sigma24 family protein